MHGNWKRNKKFSLPVHVLFFISWLAVVPLSSGDVDVGTSSTPKPIPAPTETVYVHKVRDDGKRK